jgi:excisionase family DNA binding protein
VSAFERVPSSSSHTSPQLWTLTDAASHLRISERQVRREVAAHRLRCVRIGRRLLFDPADVSRFVAARKE